ncbi:MAG: TIGR00282 family metallophosphoesterase [Acutalibacteraceae bacterium]
MLKYEKNIIRPANFPESTTPGVGYIVFDMGKIQVAVINIMGQAFMDAYLDCPFRTADKILNDTKDCKIKIVDFHAEATGEKKAMGYYLDGKVSVIFGTHTHVQTADAEILEKGTGYITDVGMTGPLNSVLGVKKEIIIEKLRNKLPVRFENENGKCKMECILVDIDDKTGKCIDIMNYQIT